MYSPFAGFLDIVPATYMAELLLRLELTLELAIIISVRQNRDHVQGNFKVRSIVAF
jgi:hypothetical protein